MRKATLSALAALALLLLPASSHAQLVQDYGVKGGITFSSLQSSKYDSVPGRRTGYSIVGFAEWLDLNAFSLMTEAGYVQRGIEASRLNYLTAAVMPKGYLSWEKWSPYVLAGPRIDFLQEGPDKVDANYVSVANVSFGGTVGAGVELPTLLPHTVVAEVRYNLSIQARTITSWDPGMRSNALDVMIGIHF